MPDVRILRSEERYETRTDRITTRHCFSYGDHYDPANVGFGPIRAINDELLAPGAGYESHHHSDIEIVTWVLDGALAHEDSTGNRGVIRPGEVQHVSAGTGIEHTERNASDEAAVRFIQMMLAPDPDALTAEPVPPTYVQHDVEGSRGRLLRAVAPRRGVELLVAMLDPGDQVALPSGELHLHVTRGAATVGTELLGAGDTARLSQPARISESGAMNVTATTASEMLVWHFTT